MGKSFDPMNCIQRPAPQLCGGSGRKLSPPAHRLDEFPVGYSWRVALQQSPLPLYQPELIVEEMVTRRQELFYNSASHLGSTGALKCASGLTQTKACLDNKEAGA